MSQLEIVQYMDKLGHADTLESAYPAGLRRLWPEFVDENGCATHTTADAHARTENLCACAVQFC